MLTFSIFDPQFIFCNYMFKHLSSLTHSFRECCHLDVQNIWRKPWHSGALSVQPHTKHLTYIWEKGEDAKYHEVTRRLTRWACSICTAAFAAFWLTHHQEEKEEEELRVFKVSDLRGSWNSWCSGFAPMFISWGQDSHQDETSGVEEFCGSGFFLKTSGEGCICQQRIWESDPTLPSGAV